MVTTIGPLQRLNLLKACSLITSAVEAVMFYERFEHNNGVSVFLHPIGANTASDLSKHMAG